MAYTVTYDDLRVEEVTTVAADVDLDPDVLSLGSRGRFITAYIEIPGRDVSLVDIATVKLRGVHGDVSAVSDLAFGFVKNPEIRDRDGDGLPELVVKFSRDAVKEVVATGWNALAISGTVNGLPFEGSNTIRVIGSGR